MGQLYVGLVAFFVTGAIIVVGCHVAICLKPLKSNLKRWTTATQTRIPGVGKMRGSTPTPMIVSSVLRTQRWPVSASEFRGFNSPPGRF
jgi:hypothetical protein